MVPSASGVVHMGGRPPSPCGTLAAYKRHLRNSEKPCTPCIQANRDAKRNQRDGSRKLRSVTVGGDVLLEGARLAAVMDRELTPISAKHSAQSDLEMSRDALVAAIDEVSHDDPTRLGPLVRELRETWKALAAVTAECGEAAEDEFARARRLRAERQAGA